MSAVSPRPALNVSAYLCQEAQNAPVGDAGDARPVYGAVLLTDIAGFTRLTEKYAALGSSGAEQLAQALDAYFGALVEAAAVHGGDVVDFIGDALVVLWRAESESDVLAACQRALACGQAFQRELSGAANRFGVPLEQRLAIGAGGMRAQVLGTATERRAFVLTGQPVVDAALCNAQAAPGEVWVAASARAFCAGIAGIEDDESGHGVLRQDIEASATKLLATEHEAESGDAEHWRAFLSPALFRHQEAGETRRLAEFRHVSVVFIRLLVDASDELAVDVLRRAHAIVQTHIDNYRGAVERWSCDEKGLTALTAFGLPYQRQEDDALRAVRASLDLHAALARANIPASIGVTRGRVFYADVGSTRRRHLELFGDAVNTAARLAGESAGVVLCDRASRDVAAAHMAFDVGRTLQLRGLASPLQAYRPLRWLEEVDHGHRAGGIADRTEELATLLGRVEDLQKGQASVTVLTGEPGIGKSHLLAEVMQRAQGHGMRLLRCAGMAIESSRPYWPWQQLFRDLLMVNAAGDQPAARQLLEAIIGEDERLRSWLPLLNDIVPLGYAANQVSAEMTGPARAAGVQNLLLRVLAHFLEQRPTVLVVDDLHWFDEASVELLDRLVESLARVRCVILIGSRPAAQAAPAAAALLQQLNAAAMSLDVIPAEYMGEFVAAKLSVPSVPSVLVDFVVARAGGHALYSEELLRAMRANQLLEVVEGRCYLSSGFGQEARRDALLPSTLDGIIVARLERLNAPVQRMLKAASAIGRDISLPLLRAVVGVENVTEWIAEAVAADFLLPTAHGPAPQYAFRHAVQADAVYGLLPLAQRQGLHRRIAEWLTDHEQGGQRDAAAVLARHWEGAREPQRAIHALDSAAVAALGRFANGEAIRHINRAYELVEAHGLPADAAREARWSRMLGDAHTELFDIEAATHYYERSLHGTAWPTPAGTAGLLFGLLRGLGLQLLLRLGLTRLRRRHAAAEALQEQLAFAAYNHTQLQRARVFQTRVLAGMYHLITALNLAERSGKRGAMVWGDAAMAVVLSGFAPRRWAQFFNRRALHNASLGGYELAGQANLHATLVAINWGDWDGVEEHSRAAATAFDALGANLRWVMATMAGATARVFRGDFSAALPQIAACKAAMPPKQTSPFVLSWPYAADMTVALACDRDTAELEEHLLQACRDTRMPAMDRLRCLGLLALSHWRGGRRGEALRAAQQAWDLAEAGALLGFWIGDGVGAMVEVFLCAALQSADPASVRKDRTLRRATRAMSLYAAATPVHRPRAKIYEGRRLHGAGQVRAARKCLDAALAEARDRRMPMDEALALTALADLGQEDRSRCRAGAREIFTRLGAAYHLRQAAVRESPAQGESAVR